MGRIGCTDLNFSLSCKRDQAQLRPHIHYQPQSTPRLIKGGLGSPLGQGPDLVTAAQAREGLLMSQHSARCPPGAVDRPKLGARSTRSHSKRHGLREPDQSPSTLLRDRRCAIQQAGPPGPLPSGNPTHRAAILPHHRQALERDFVQPNPCVYRLFAPHPKGQTRHRGRHEHRWRWRRRNGVYTGEEEQHSSVLTQANTIQRRPCF